MRASSDARSCRRWCAASGVAGRWSGGLSLHRLRLRHKSAARSTNHVISDVRSVLADRQADQRECPGAATIDPLFLWIHQRPARHHHVSRRRVLCSARCLGIRSSTAGMAVACERPAQLGEDLGVLSPLPLLLTPQERRPIPGSQEPVSLRLPGRYRRPVEVVGRWMAGNIADQESCTQYLVAAGRSFGSSLFETRKLTLSGRAPR